MKPLFLTFVFLMLAACAPLTPPLPAPSSGRAPASPESADAVALVAQGAAFAAANCAACHAIGPTGTGQHPMAPPFRDIAKRYPVRQLSEAFAEGIVTAHPDMPEFILTVDDNRSLIAYLESVQTPRSPDSPE